MSVLTKEQKHKFYKFIREQLEIERKIYNNLLEQADPKKDPKPKPEDWRTQQKKELDTEFVDDKGQAFSAEEAGLSAKELEDLERERIKFKTDRNATGITGSGFSESVIDLQYDVYNAMFYADIAKDTYSLLAPKFIKEAGSRQGKRLAAAAVGYMAKNGVKNVLVKGAMSAGFRGFLGGTATMLGLGAGFLGPLVIGIVGPIVLDVALEWLIVEKDIFGVRGGLAVANPHRQKFEKELDAIRAANKRYYAPVGKNYEADAWDIWPIPVQNRWCDKNKGEKPYIRRDKGVQADGPDCSEVKESFASLSISFPAIQAEFDMIADVLGTTQAQKDMERDFPHLSFNKEGLDMSEIAFNKAVQNVDLFSENKLDDMVAALEGQRPAEEEAENPVSLKPEEETGVKNLSTDKKTAAALAALGAAGMVGGAKAIAAARRVILRKIKGHGLERKQRLAARKTKLTMMQISKNMKDYFPKNTGSRPTGAYTPDLYYAISDFQKKNQEKLKEMGVRKPITGIYDSDTHKVWLETQKEGAKV